VTVNASRLMSCIILFNKKLIFRAFDILINTHPSQENHSFGILTLPHHVFVWFPRAACKPLFWGGYKTPLLAQPIYMQRKRSFWRSHRRKNDNNNR